MKKLNQDIALGEILENVKEQKNQEFICSAKDLNIDDPIEFTKNLGKRFRLPIITPLEELIPYTLIQERNNLSFILIWATLKRAEITLELMEDKDFIVRIEFD